ncbi:aminopeptidase [Acidisoma silvae]|uniref:Aminopeptidase n=1 Tax=Acidisoma silvae TaxID=2802396 RepID=A0A963YSY0_9PROT|nr:aminopeptidase [Acidisoma silvae]MCB8875768.1 aminopeptidase [Acidisoma silvae]
MDFETKLDRLAEVAVKTGLGLAPGQELVMTAPLESLPLARLITRHAYKAGASLVTTFYGDDDATLARFELGSNESFDTAPAWLFEGMAKAYGAGAARLAISGENPALLAGQDADKVSRANRARSKAYQPALQHIVDFHINWSIVSFASTAWATMVFPDATESDAVMKLWDAIFAASRIDQADPVAAWAAHNARLHDRKTFLNDKRFSALRFRGPGTDLTVGLADAHEWAGGSEKARNGITCNPNIPTEEVFTTPHARRVDGFVRSTKPLSYQGTLIEDISVRFEAGKIVEAKARTGEEVLQKVLETDEGAARLGEVALVPHSSPISQSGILFYNTLYDENAACHIALGQAYNKCIIDFENKTEAQLVEAGANRSLIHIDWMIGSGEIDIDGVTASGGTEAVMRGGEWAI